MAELFEDFRIGNKTARNRMLRAATAESLCTLEGAPSKRMIDYYGELARGGVGTIVTGYAYVAPDGKPSERALCLCDDAVDAPLRELVEHVHSQRIEDVEIEVLKPVALPKVTPDGHIVADEPEKRGAHAAPAGGGSHAAHAAGAERTPAHASERASAGRHAVIPVSDTGTQALVFAQLVYGGSKSKLATDDPRWLPQAAEGDAAGAEEAPATPAAPEQPAIPNVDIVGPSAVKHPATGLVPRAATADDLQRIVVAFASAAARAKRLGFDGVELHAGHGYLLSQFLDGRFNRRVDEYGGTLQNRARLLVECMRAVRLQVGAGYPVLVKLNSCDVLGDVEGAAGGLSENESLQVAEWLVEAGASAIEVTGDWHGVDAENVSGEPFFGAFGTRLAVRLGQSAPVIVTGGWRDLETIERYLQTTGIAGIGMSRPLICQTILPELWRSGMDRPAECTSCGWCLGKNGIPCILRRGHS